jgi:hypothetical protein
VSTVGVVYGKEIHLVWPEIVALIIITIVIEASNKFSTRGYGHSENVFKHTDGGVLQQKF